MKLILKDSCHPGHELLKDIHAYNCVCTIIIVSIVLSELGEGKRDHNDDASWLPRRPRGGAH